MIYFIRQGGSSLIKIGYTDQDPKRRLSDLQVGCSDELSLIGVTAGGPSDERRIHDYFRADWVRGEWFTASPAMGRMIALGRPLFRELVAWSPSLLDLPPLLIMEPWSDQVCFVERWHHITVDRLDLWAECKRIAEGRDPSLAGTDAVCDAVGLLHQDAEEALRPLLHSCSSTCKCKKR